MNEQQHPSVRAFTDNQAQAFQDLSKRSAPQIMQTTILRLDNFRNRGKTVFFHRILAEPQHRNARKLPPIYFTGEIEETAAGTQ